MSLYTRLFAGLCSCLGAGLVAFVAAVSIGAMGGAQSANELPVMALLGLGLVLVAGGCGFSFFGEHRARDGELQAGPESSTLIFPPRVHKTTRLKRG
jgi:hypothetical protein